MKKMLKKAMSVVLALSVVMAFSFTCFAVDGKGSITIDNASKEATYNAYKVFEASVDTSNNAITYTKIKDFAYGDDFGTYFEVVNGQVKAKDAAKDTNGDLNSDAIAYLKTLVTGNADATKVADSDTVVLDNLDYGYYVVTSTVNGGTAISVTSTNPDVTIQDKNQKPHWDNDPEDPYNPGTDDDEDDNDPGKVITAKNTTSYVTEKVAGVSENNAEIGDKLSFSIGIQATKYDGAKKITQLVIADKLGVGFKTPDNFKVYVNGNEVNYVKKQDGNTFNIYINDIDKIEGLPATYDVKVTYDAVVDSDAVIGEKGNPNIANFTWKTKDDEITPPDDPFDQENPKDPDSGEPEDPDNPFKPDNTKETDTYVLALGITKVDANNENKVLNGAEFDFGGLDATKTLVGSDGVYKVEELAEGATQNVHVVLPAGTLVISGLDAQEYTLTETKAPDGYTLDTTTKTFNLGTETVKTDAGTISEVPVAVNTTIGNTVGSPLPSTGGIGTTIFYILGALLVVGAAIMLIARRRVNE